MKKHEKIRRKRIVREFNCYHEPLITASRYVMGETKYMFQSIYVDITERWDFDGVAAVRVYVMFDGKMYYTRGRYFVKNEFDSMYKRDISPELYCRAILTADIFDLYAKLISKEDKNLHRLSLYQCCSYFTDIATGGFSCK